MFGFTSRPRAQELAAPAAPPSQPNQQAAYKPPFLQTLDLVLGGRTFTDAQYELQQREMARQDMMRQRAMAERQMELLDQAARFAIGGGMGGDMAPAPVDNRAVTAVRPDDFTSAGYDVATPRAPAMAGGMGQPGRTGTSRDFLPFVLGGIATGVPQLVEMGKVLSQYDPELEKGQMWQGNRVISAPGFDAATAGTAGSVAGAQAQANSAFELVDVPMADGTVRTMPLLQAIQIMSGGGAMPQPSGASAGGGVGAPMPAGQGARAPQSGAGFGVRPSAAQVAGATAQATGQVGLDIAAQERRAAARSALPKVEDDVRLATSILGKITGHERLRARTGLSSRLPIIDPRDQDFEALREQALGGAFLTAYEALRGAQAITDIEGDKATKAIARFQNPNLSEEGFLDALADYESVINAGLERLRKSAGVTGAGGTTGGPTRAQREAEARRRGLIP